MSPRGRLFSDFWRHEPPTKQFLSGGEVNRGAVITNERPLLGGCLSNQAHLITQKPAFVNRVTSRSLLFASPEFTRVREKKPEARPSHAHRRSLREKPQPTSTVSRHRQCPASRLAFRVGLNRKSHWTPTPARESQVRPGPTVSTDREATRDFGRWLHP